MCVILQSPKGVTPKEEMLEAAYSNNKHGFGIFFPAKGGKVHAHKILPKNFDDVTKVWRLYKDERVSKGLHFRLRTSGDIEKSNSHPFRVLSKAEHGREIWLMHNGTITGVPKYMEARSDTWHFVNYMLRPMLAANPKLVADKEFHKMMSNMVGNDRLLLLDGETGEFHKINPTSSGGHERERIWVSNNYGLREPYKASASPRKNFYAGGDVSTGANGITPTGNNVYNVSGDVMGSHKAFTYVWDDAKLAFEQEVTGVKRLHATKTVFFQLIFKVRNISDKVLDNVGIRCQLDRVCNTNFEKIEVLTYETYGPFKEVQDLKPAMLYINDRTKTSFKPNEIGTIKLSIKASEFKLPNTYGMSSIPNVLAIGPTVGTDIARKPTITAIKVDIGQANVIALFRPDGDTPRKTVADIMEGKGKPATDELVEDTGDHLNYLLAADLMKLKSANDTNLTTWIKQYPEVAAELLRDYMELK